MSEQRSPLVQLSGRLCGAHVGYPVSAGRSHSTFAWSSSLDRSASTDFSARWYVRRSHRNNAGAAFMGMAIGAIGAVIANEQRRSCRRQYVKLNRPGIAGGSNS
jgi:hypothetical protein